ncbi:hypothetical protein [Mycolicibacterium sp.]|uniref:hypothetical protein n=1 Tax=Mycolicibacterium sp. TaxID=2320850 RepID=UPI0028AD32EA|nr:hypothetical protein [Mycolicibacterium sp.]
MIRTLLAALAASLVSALLLAAPVAAVPTCTRTGPTTTTCVTGGHTAITTTPNPALSNPWPGWGVGWGTPVIGLGGGGVWIGF